MTHTKSHLSRHNIEDANHTRNYPFFWKFSICSHIHVCIKAFEFEVMRSMIRIVHAQFRFEQRPPIYPHLEMWANGIYPHWKSGQMGKKG